MRGKPGHDPRLARPAGRNEGEQCEDTDGSREAQGRKGFEIVDGPGGRMRVEKIRNQEQRARANGEGSGGGKKIKAGEERDAQVEAKRTPEVQRKTLQALGERMRQTWNCVLTVNAPKRLGERIERGRIRANWRTRRVAKPRDVERHIRLRIQREWGDSPISCRARVPQREKGEDHRAHAASESQGPERLFLTHDTKDDDGDWNCKRDRSQGSGDRLPRDAGR